jgi:hypothetical protein
MAITIVLQAHVNPNEGVMNRTLDIAAVVFAVLLLLGFLAVSLVGLNGPEGASARFGLPIHDAAGAMYYRVYASRNLVLVAAAVIFLLLRRWTPLAVLVSLSAALPLFDMSVLTLNGVRPPPVHFVALALIAVTAALIWRRAARG